MGLKLFNTLTRSTTDFVPLDPGGQKVRMYCCGPTVHNYAHIGNFRTFVFADLLRRYLEFKSFAVRHVMNVTDVEDKIIAGVRSSGRSLRDFTRQYEAAFFQDFGALNCRQPHHTPHATHHIAEIIDLIEKLKQRGLAYQAADGSVYFSIEQYRGRGHVYGQLIHLKFDQMRAGERVSADEYDKEFVGDFALWKARVPEDGEVFWPSPWGEGRPGWHIECSAMSTKLLGPEFDLHLGGEDLIFPHHEDEIAQSEGAGLLPAGRRFVARWLHVAHLLVEGKKMSKSLGNFYTLRDLLEKGFSGREIRYLLLTAHYRATCNFTLENLNGARSALGRLDEWFTSLHEIAAGAHAAPDAELLAKFSSAMDDDLNVSAAWGFLFDSVRELNKLIASGQLERSRAAATLSAWEQIASVLGISLVRFERLDEKTLAQAAGASGSGAALTAAIPPEILQLLEDRQAARKAKDFKKADAIRAELSQAGWVIEDTPAGPRLKRG